jgi:fumarylacetoacetase
VQRWETQPLGPFLAKSFSTTVSPWVITPEALAPFRIAQAPRPEGDPRPLPYLWDETDQRQGAFDIELEALMLTEGLRAKKLTPHRLALSNTNHLYWTTAQMVAHHASGGCNLNPGDLFGTGTISGPTRESYGSLGEISEGGLSPSRCFGRDAPSRGRRRNHPARTCTAKGFVSPGLAGSRKITPAV